MIYDFLQYSQTSADGVQVSSGNIRTDEPSCICPERNVALNDSLTLARKHISDSRCKIPVHRLSYCPIRRHPSTRTKSATSLGLHPSPSRRPLPSPGATKPVHPKAVATFFARGAPGHPLIQSLITAPPCDGSYPGDTRTPFASLLPCPRPPVTTTASSSQWSERIPLS